MQVLKTNLQPVLAVFVNSVTISLAEVRILLFAAMCVLIILGLYMVKDGSTTCKQ